MGKILFIFPSIVNNPEIARIIAIFNGIAKNKFWATDYFDTYAYEKQSKTTASITARSNSGEFKPTAGTNIKIKPHHRMITDIQDKINAFNPDIIAITCNSYEYEFLLTFWPKIKIAEKTKVIIGGVHSVLKPDEVISTGLFDVVCAGDGEEAFSDILLKYKDKKSLGNIKNTYYRDGLSGKITKNSQGELIDEKVLWKFIPDYSLFDDKYFIYPFHGKLYRRFRFEVGRGCPYNCAYCANSALKSAYTGLGKYFRSRPLKDMKIDMEDLLDKYKIEMFFLDDECFLAHSIGWLNEFFEWYGRNIRKPFIFQTRPETITEEKIKILKESKAPFFLVKIGIESGSERILRDVCNRTTKIERIINAFEILNRYNIMNAAGFMIGLPFETREDIFKTIELCRKIKPNEVLVSIFQPMPGQKLREVCIKEGFIKEDDKPCFFTDRSILKMPQISRKEIENLRRTFPLYATLPRKYFSEIEQCEKDYDNNEKLYKKLVNLRWGLK